MAQSVFLRLMLHPAHVSRAESHVHLLELGDGALKAARAAESEPAVADFAATLRREIGEPAKQRPGLPELKDPYDAEMQRFVQEELIGGYPHDPSFGFARRLNLLGQHGAPYALALTSSAHPLVRRNAVLALGRYDAPAATARAIELLDHADPVVRARALSVIRTRRHAPAAPALVARLGRSPSDPERCALIHALGFVGDDVAAGAILGQARRSSANADVLIAAIPALSRLNPGDATIRKATLAFLAETLDQTRRRPAAFDPKGKAPSRAADFPDPPGTRAQVIEELCALAIARMKGKDEFGIVKAMKNKNKNVTIRGGYTNPSVQGFLPAAQMLLLETLPALGDEGVGALAAVVDDRHADPVLRNHALVQMPDAPRLQKALALARQLVEEHGEAELFAFELLTQRGHESLASIARDVLKTAPQNREPYHRYAATVAVRALVKGGTLTPADLEPVLPRLDFSFEVGSPELTRQALEGYAADLMDAALKKLGENEGARRMKALLDYGIEHRTHPDLTAQTRASVEKRILELVAAGVAGRNDAGFLKITRESIVRTVMAGASGFTGGEIKFEPQIPLEETVLLAIGQLGDPKSLPLLEDVLKRGAPLHRAAASLALAATRQKQAGDLLVGALGDQNGFVRTCAYEGLKSLSGRDHFGRWMYGAPADRAAATEAYQQWLAER